MHIWTLDTLGPAFNLSATRARGPGKDSNLRLSPFVYVRLTIVSLLKKLPTSVLELLTKRLSDTVQILTAFLFHSPHHVALRTYDLNHMFATTRSSNCLFSIPVEGSYWITFSLGSYIKCKL